MNVMGNYNSTNPFVLICKDNNNKLRNTFVKAITNHIIELVIDVILLILSVVLVILYKNECISVLIVINAISIASSAYSLFFTIKNIIKHNDLEEVDKVINAQFEEVLTMNNESIMNAIMKINTLQGITTNIITSTRKDILISIAYNIIAYLILFIISIF